MKQVYNFIAKPLETHTISYYVDFPVFDESMYFELLINPNAVTIRNQEYSYKPTSNLNAIRDEMRRLGETANQILRQRDYDVPTIVKEQEFESHIPVRDEIEAPVQASERNERYSIRKKFASILVDRERSISQKRYSKAETRTPQITSHQPQDEVYIPREIRSENAEASKTYHDLQSNSRNTPPTIDDLLKGNANSDEKASKSILNPEDELEERQELLAKFARLRMKYSNMDSLAISIPDFSIRSDLQKMRVSYSSISRLLKTQKTIADYKKYLTYVFIGVEFIFGHWLGFNMDGYLASQKDSISSYDSLLMELSEKYNKEKKSKVPVELRLVGMMGLNIVMFVIANNLMSGQFGVLGNIMGSMLKGGKMKNASTYPAEKKSGMKMRKPTVTLDKIRQSAENSDQIP